MKKIQLLSIVFSLIMFTGMTAGSTAFAEIDRKMMTEQLDAFCEMTSDEQETFVTEHPKMEKFSEQIAVYCQIESADERLAYLEEQITQYKHDHKTKNMKNMREHLDAFCNLSSDEQAELIAKYNKSEDKVAKMNEYCSLDEDGRAAFIEEHKAEYKAHHGEKMHKEMKKSVKSLSSEDREGFKADFKTLQAEFKELKAQLSEDGTLSAEEKHDLRMQFIEKARQIQLSWITPQN